MLEVVKFSRDICFGVTVNVIKSRLRWSSEGEAFLGDLYGLWGLNSCIDCWKMAAGPFFSILFLCTSSLGLILRKVEVVMISFSSSGRSMLRCMSILLTALSGFWFGVFERLEYRWLEPLRGEKEFYESPSICFVSGMSPSRDSIHSSVIVASLLAMLFISAALIAVSYKWSLLLFRRRLVRTAN